VLAQKFRINKQQLRRPQIDSKHQNPKNKKVMATKRLSSFEHPHAFFASIYQ
jgi:hypothetical protein